MIYYIYYVLFNDNSYKPIVIIAVYDTGWCCEQNGVL